MGLMINGQAVPAIQIVVWLVVALVCGAVAEAILGYTHVGLLASFGVGLVGALGGTWLASTLHLPPFVTLNFAGVQIELLWALVGSLLLVALTSTARYRGYRRY